MIWILITLVALWVLFNWLAAFAPLVRAERISPGRLPHELFTWADARKVRFYISDLFIGYGFSIWAPPLHIVVFDRRFFRMADPLMVRFVVAHELAHFSFGHHRKRFLAVVTGAILLPSVKRWLARTEDEADAEAARRTGVTRSYILQQLTRPNPLGVRHEERSNPEQRAVT